MDDLKTSKGTIKIRDGCEYKGDVGKTLGKVEGFFKRKKKDGVPHGKGTMEC